MRRPDNDRPRLRVEPEPWRNQKMLRQETVNRADAAAMARQVGIDFGASLTVALAYIGDRLGIFKSMAAGESLTSSQIAERTGLNERYIREWASSMGAAGYFEY